MGEVFEIDGEPGDASEVVRRRGEPAGADDVRAADLAADLVDELRADLAGGADDNDGRLFGEGRGHGFQKAEGVGLGRKENLWWPTKEEMVVNPMTRAPAM